ncbi:MAG: hypothetical protein Q8N23_23320 [Archangium sp.]|nr:hypothetical protein [Archangium sp.]MDP3570772.1 hypothetical protein [Archangium sp.]
MDTCPKLWLAGVLLIACGSPAPDQCLAARDIAANDSCVVLSGNWAFFQNEQPPDYLPHCSASCIDVDGGVTISGFRSLEEVPLLRKMRQVRALSLDVHVLANLSGLEAMEMERLILGGTGEGDAFQSMTGLNVRQLQSLSVHQVSSSNFLSGAALERVAAASFSATGLESLDLGGLEIDQLKVESNERLSRLVVPGSAMRSVSINYNSLLSELGWDAGTSVQTIQIFENKSLSSCTVEAFALATKADGGRAPWVFANGPCP